MTLDLEQAKELLFEKEYTCVLKKDSEIHTSNDRGVKPLLIWLDSGMDFHGFSAADKVVGKAAAMIYVLLGVKEVYASVISIEAKRMLEKYQITVFYGELTERIHNRTNTGFCPMEEAVWEIEDLQEAVRAVREKLKQLASSNGKMENSK